MTELTLDVDLKADMLCKALEKALKKHIEEAKEQVLEEAVEQFRTEVGQVLLTAGLEITRVMRINHFGQEIAFSINLNDIRSPNREESS
jgi:hypothetical protein